MQLMLWETRFNLGIETFDTHHMRLFDILNNAYNSVQLNDTQRINALLDELREYASYHFSAEEELMGRHSYLGLVGHANEHEEFLSHISVFQQSMKNNEPLYKVPIVVFLREWFINHVLVVDRGYVKLLDNDSKP